MNIFSIIKAALLVILLATHAETAESDLKIVIRANSQRTIFGDPIYFEVQFINEGHATIEGPAPDLLFNTFGFSLYDPETRLERRIGGGPGLKGGLGKMTVQPSDGIQKRFFTFFLPPLSLGNDVFWKGIRDGGRLFIRGRYELRENVTITSNVEQVDIYPRPAEELEWLEAWAGRDKDVMRHPAFGPERFGLEFRVLLARAHVLEIAEQLKPGEIADLLKLTSMLQEIYDTPYEKQGPLNAALVNELRIQVNFKREVLIQTAREIASGFANMRSTVEAIDAIPRSR